MGRYYFDIRDGDHLAPDEEGIEISRIEDVEEEAALSLADIARDAVKRVHRGKGRRLAVEVRDSRGPVLEATFVCGFDRHRRS